MPFPARATTMLTIDVAAVVANWRRIAAMVAPAEAAAVVKADCYGLGAAHIAPALFAAGCRSFFVATIDEGIRLRRDLPDGAIYVLSGPLPGTEADFAAHRLIPVLNSLPQVAGWTAGGGAACVIHIDTAMNRLGLEQGELERLTSDPQLLGANRPVLIMSHLACADETQSPVNQAQLTAFHRLCGGFAAIRRSLAASSGVFLGPAFHFDMVRPGAALYGLNPTPDHPNPMAQVVRLQGKILQVRDVDSPMTVGYGATHRVARRGRLATVAIGYADGWFRSLGNRGHGVIGGIKVPVAGRVSMDLTSFDVTEVPSALLHPGALVDLIGPTHTADDVAADAGTIGYEILTALGRRHHRRWLSAGEAGA